MKLTKISSNNEYYLSFSQPVTSIKSGKITPKEFKVTMNPPKKFTWTGYIPDNFNTT